MAGKIKFNKNGKLIRQKENLVIKHSDYWQDEINLAIKENKNNPGNKK